MKKFRARTTVLGHDRTSQWGSSFQLPSSTNIILVTWQISDHHTYLPICSSHSWFSNPQILRPHFTRSLQDRGMSWKLAELRWRHELGLRDRKTERFQDSRARTTFSTQAQSKNLSGDPFGKESNDPHDSRHNAHAHQSSRATDSEIPRSFYHPSSLSTTPLLAHVQALDREPRTLYTRASATAPPPVAHRFQRSATTSGACESRGSPIKRSGTLCKLTDGVIDLWLSVRHQGIRPKHDGEQLEEMVIPLSLNRSLSFGSSFEPLVNASRPL